MSKPKPKPTAHHTICQCEKCKDSRESAWLPTTCALCGIALQAGENTALVKGVLAGLPGIAHAGCAIYDSAELDEPRREGVDMPMKRPKPKKVGK